MFPIVLTFHHILPPHCKVEWVCRDRFYCKYFLGFPAFPADVIPLWWYPAAVATSRLMPKQTPRCFCEALGSSGASEWSQAVGQEKVGIWSKEFVTLIWAGHSSISRTTQEPDIAVQWDNTAWRAFKVQMLSFCDDFILLDRFQSQLKASYFLRNVTQHKVCTILHLERLNVRGDSHHRCVPVRLVIIMTSYINQLLCSV